MAGDSTARVGLDRAGSTRDTHCEVVEVPADISDAQVISQMTKIAFWPWPTSILWSRIAGLPQGAFIRNETVS
jgi:hypothetical protein